MMRVVFMSVTLYSAAAVALCSAIYDAWQFLETGRIGFLSLADIAGRVDSSWEGLETLVNVYLAAPLWLSVPAAAFVLILAQSRSGQESSR